MKAEYLIESPLGPLVATFEGDSLTSLSMSPQRGEDVASPVEPAEDSESSEKLRYELQEYFAGTRKTFETKLAPEGPEFRQSVWAELQKIPYGATITYGELALRMGDPNMARAVGAANGANPIAILIPCHRVIGADGSLVGYAGGLENKRFLLDLEGALTPSLPFD